MIKIIPIIISPLIFFYIYYNVVFLTDQNTENLENKVKVPETVIHDSGTDSSPKNQLSNNERIDLAQSTDKKISQKAPKGEELDSKKKVDVKLKAKEVKEEESVIKPVENKKNRKNLEAVVKIQFGAFKKYKNAQRLENKLRKLFKKDFREIPDSFEIIEKDHHYKVIYLSNSNSLAEKLCKFSKSKKINCIFL